MTAASSLLKDFAARRESSDDLRFLSEEELEDERLTAFEKGYGAGWEDALRSVEKNAAAMDETFRQRIEDLGFTYYEAHAAMVKEISAIVTAVCNKALPSIAQNTLGAHISEMLTDLAKSAGEMPVHIVVHPEQAPILEAVVASSSGFPITVKSDASMSLAQAEMRFSDHATLVDLGSATDEILELLAAFHHSVGSLKIQGATQNVTK